MANKTEYGLESHDGWQQATGKPICPVNRFDIDKVQTKKNPALRGFF
ncbi:hypothetical protein [Yersinia massiliensis]|nr:hypothetical protein [Yersinia massiliensis]